jgi:UDP-hydrolysing UDP-N-acetyl-D-glucosamine 2-epimerase
MIFISSRADRYLMQPFVDQLGENPKYLMVLGDRRETFQRAVQAFLDDLPIIHIHGGERTPCSKDDVYRDCITRMATVHFPPTLEAATRIYQINPKATVVPCGAVGAELAANHVPIERSILEGRGFKMGQRTWLVTFHPQEGEDVQELINALKETDDAVLWTYPNADPGNEEIIDKIRASGFPVYTELGMETYLSLAKICTAVVGNSSSGIIEIPVLGTPVINIGKRQEGRPQATGIINAPCDTASIRFALICASPTSGSPYYIPGTIDTIVRTVKRMYGG